MASYVEVAVLQAVPPQVVPVTWLHPFLSVPAPAELAFLHPIRTASSGLLRTRTIIFGFCHMVFSAAISWPPPFGGSGHALYQCILPYSVVKRPFHGQATKLASSGYELVTVTQFLV